MANFSEVTYFDDTNTFSISPLSDFTYNLRGPLVASIQITRRCNLACRYCSESSSPRNQTKDPTLGDIAKILSPLREADAKKVTLTGGDPLVREDIRSIIQVAAETGLAISMCSNLLLMTDALAEFLAKHLIHCELSTDDITNGRLTKGGEEISNKIKIAREAGLRIYISIVIKGDDFAAQIKKIEAVLDLCKKYEINTLKFRPINRKGRGRTMREEVFTTSNEVRDLWEFARTYKRKFEIPTRLKAPDPGVADRDGQTILIHPNGDWVGTPCRSTSNSTYLIGNLLDPNSHIQRDWERYPWQFAQNHVRKYLLKTYLVDK